MRSDLEDILYKVLDLLGSSSVPLYINGEIPGYTCSNGLFSETQGKWEYCGGGRNGRNVFNKLFYNSSFEKIILVMDDVEVFYGPIENKNIFGRDFKKEKKIRGKFIVSVDIPNWEINFEIIDDARMLDHLLYSEDIRDVLKRTSSSEDFNFVSLSFNSKNGDIRDYSIERGSRTKSCKN